MREKSLWKKCFTSLVVLANLSFASASAEYIGNFGPGPDFGNYYGDPCCDPCNNPCCDWGSLRLRADALYVKTNEDGIDFCDEVTFSSNVVSGVDTPITKVRALVPSFDRHWAFRVGLGYEDPCSCWGVDFNWTHLNNRAHRHKEVDYTGQTAGTFKYLVPLWASRELRGFSCEGSLHLNLNLYDLEVGRYFCICDCVNIRPHIGLRGASIRQSYNIETLGPDDTLTFDDDIKLRNQFKGVGIRGGLDSKWDIGCGVSLFGQAAASILWGSFRVNSHERFVERVTATGEVDTHETFHLRNHFHSAKGITDLAIGLSWDYECACNQWIDLRIAYEHHLFFEQNHFRNDVFDPDESEGSNFRRIKNPGDLSFHGLVLGASYRF